MSKQPTTDRQTITVEITKAEQDAQIRVMREWIRRYPKSAMKMLVELGHLKESWTEAMPRIS